MKIVIASDIHGSAFYCEQLLTSYHREAGDMLLLLGDILYHGPRNALPEGYAPWDVTAMLNPLADRILCVRGNCDAEVDQMVLDFPMMSDSLLLQERGLTIFATHGHVFSPENPPKLAKPYLLLSGHTHLQVCKAYPGFLHVNPGSVSLPKEDSRRAYLVLEDNTLTWKTLEGEPFRIETISL